MSVTLAGHTRADAASALLGRPRLLLLAGAGTISFSSILVLLSGRAGGAAMPAE